MYITEMKRQPYLRFWLVFVLHLLTGINRSSIAGASEVNILSPSTSRIAKDTSLLMQCSITDFVPSLGHGLAWTKQNAVIAWNGQLQANVDATIVSVSNFTSGSYTIYSLTISKFSSENEGVYACLVTNGILGSFTTEVSDTKYLQVFQDYPVCSPSVESFYVAGSQITIQCRIESESAYASPNLFWQNQRTNVLETGTETLQEYARVLQLQVTATPELDGTKYLCFSTETPSQSCLVGPLQVIPGYPIISPKSLTVYEGHTAEFTCALPTADSTNDWYTTPLTPSLRTIILSPTSFSIRETSVTMDNGKTIICKAFVGNHILEDRATLTVIPTTQPPTTQPTTTQPTTTQPTTTTAPEVTTTILTTTRETATTTEHPAVIITTRLVTTREKTTGISTTSFPNPPTESREVTVPVIDSTTVTTTSDSLTDLSREPTTEKPIYTTSAVAITDSAVASNVILIAVGSAGALFLLIIIIIIVVAAMCFCDRHADSKYTDETGTTTQGSSFYSWDQMEGKIPIDIPMDALDGSIRSSTNTHLSDTMRAMPGGYRDRTPLQSVRFPGHRGTLSGSDTLDGTTISGSVMDFNSQVESDFTGRMTPQQLRHPHGHFRTGSMSEDHFRTGSMSEDSGHHSSLQDSFIGSSRRGSSARLLGSAAYGRDSMKGFPNGPSFAGVDNPMVGDYPDYQGSSYQPVSETYPVLDVDEMPPYPPPMRRTSSLQSGLQPGTSSVIYNNAPPRPPKIGQQRGTIEHVADYNRPPLRRSHSNQEMAFADVHSLNDRGQAMGWNGQGHGQGMMYRVPGGRPGGPNVPSYESDKPHFKEYTDADDMLF